MPPKDINILSIWFTDTKTGERFELNGFPTIESTIEPVVNEEDKGEVVYRFDKEYWEKPITFACNDVYADFSRIFTNNWRRRRGKNPLPYRKLFKYNKRYALVIYQKQRKYIQDKYTFDEWKRKKGIV